MPIGQKIPDNWRELSLNFSKQTLEYFADKSISVIVTANQTFVKFLLAQENLLVPTGVKRVGTSVHNDDERWGETLMPAADIWRKNSSR